MVLVHQLAIEVQEELLLYVAIGCRQQRFSWGLQGMVQRWFMRYQTY